MVDNIPCAVFHRIGEPTPDRFTHSIDQIKNCDMQITLDGIYTSVWDHREEIGELARQNPLWLFVAGDTLGTEGFIDKQQLMTLVDEYDCLMAWHTWSHADLTQLSDDEIRHELDAPDWIPRTTFAYPYGNFDNRVIELVKEAGYQSAYSTTQGRQGDNYAIIRYYI